MITLRSIREDDLPLTLKWRNDDRIRKQFVHSDVVDGASHLRWFCEQMSKEPRPFGFIICDDARPVGQCWLYDFRGKVATFGRFMIGEDDMVGKGHGKEALRLVIERARALKLEALTLSVKVDNHNALQLYRRVGFIEEGGSDGMLEMRLDL